MIDLHAHTTASDGSLTPAQLVDMARSLKLIALGVTDHDSIDGLPEALACGMEAGLTVIPGVEISAEFKPGTMHMLGYYIDRNHQGLAGKLSALQESRRTRNPKIVEKLNTLGFEITLEEIEEAAGGGQVGRPHFAKVMLKKGYVNDVQEAFDRYLTKGGPAYMDKYRFTPLEAIAMIQEAGGLPVLAHPHTLKLEAAALDKLVASLVDAGLVGLEAYYPEHDPDMTAQYISLADKFGLIVTGGSDYHGETKAEFKLGRVWADREIPDELFIGLKKKREQGI